MPVNDHYANLIAYLLYLRTLHALNLNKRIEKTTYMMQLNDLLGAPGSQEGSIRILLKSLNIGTLNELRKLLKSYEMDPAEMLTIECLLRERKVISGELHQKMNKDVLQLIEEVRRAQEILSLDTPLTYDAILTYVSELISKAERVADDEDSTWPVLEDLRGLQKQIEGEAHQRASICPADSKKEFMRCLKSIHDKICQ